MADGFDWVSRKLGVCFATFCLEATNILAGIATVHADSAPTVAVTGQVLIAMIGRDALQERDIIGIKLFHNLYKHACAVAKIQISYLRMGLVKHTTIKWTGRDLNPRSDACHAPILPGLDDRPNNQSSD